MNEFVFGLNRKIPMAAFQTPLVRGFSIKPDEMFSNCTCDLDKPSPA
jgi:hypothetical protein